MARKLTIWKILIESAFKLKCNRYADYKNSLAFLFLSFNGSFVHSFICLFYFILFLFFWYIRLATECKTGDVRVTKGYNLPAKYIIHTVGPIYSERYKTAAEQTLYSCYRWVNAIKKFKIQNKIPKNGKKEHLNGKLSTIYVVLCVMR